MRRAARPLLALAALLLSLAAAEFAARAVVRWRTPPGMVFDPEIIYTYQRARRGWGHHPQRRRLRRRRRWGERDADLRVLLLGGSTSFSRSYVDTVRARLRDRLEVAEVAVMSCGKPALHLGHHRVVLDRMLPRYRPHAVVLYLGINDNIYNTFRWVDGSRRRLLDWRSPRESLLVRMVRYHVLEKRLWSRPDFGPGELRSVAILAGNVEAMVAAAAGAGVAGRCCARSRWPCPPTTRNSRPGCAPQSRSWSTFGGTSTRRCSVSPPNNRAIAEIRLPARAAAGACSLADTAGDSRHFLDLCHLTARATASSATRWPTPWPAPILDRGRELRQARADQRRPASAGGDEPAAAPGARLAASGVISIQSTAAARGRPRSLSGSAASRNWSTTRLRPSCQHSAGASKAAV